MGTVKAVGIVTVFAFVSKITGFLREMAIARGFGAGLYTDAYKVAQGIPGLFFTLVGTALATVLVPAITQALQKDKDEAFTFANRMATAVFLASAGLAFVGFVSVPLLVRILAPGFSAEALEITSGLTRILVPSLLFSTLASVSTGLNHSLGEFVGPAVKHLPANLFIILAATVLHSRLGIWGLAWATVLGLAFELFVQVPFLYRKGFRFAWRLDLHDPAIRHVALLMVPVVVGSALGQINTVVSRAFASTLPEGSISVLAYASTLTGFVSGIVVTAMSTVMLTQFSRLAAEGRRDRLGASVANAISSLNAMVIPMAVGLIVLRIPAIRFVYQRGAFTASDTALVAGALVWTAVGLVGSGIRSITAACMYALKDTRTPMVNGLWGMLVNIALLFLFVDRWGMGITGMALAGTCSATYAGVMLTIRLHRKIGGLGIEGFIESTWRTIAASVIMAIVTYFANPAVEGLVTVSSFLWQAARLGVVIAIGGATYILALTLLGSKEAKNGWTILRRGASRVSMR